MSIIARRLVALVIGGLCVVPVSAQLPPGSTTRVSVATDGAEGNAASSSPAISANGRFVAFASDASNLVAGDTNDARDVFVHDRDMGVTTRVSVASDGTQGNGSSSETGTAPAISAVGRYVAFDSDASNLVSGDTNGWSDVFVHDRAAGTTTRVSVATDGTQGNGLSYSPAISADGRIVAFQSLASNLVRGDTYEQQDVFVHDRATGVTTRVSVATDGTQGNSYSGDPSISGDGRYVAFSSDASTLVAGDTNGHADVFVHDRATGVTTRVSVATDGTQGNSFSWGNAISADGRCVAFYSEAGNLVPGDTNGQADTFIHDRATGATTRVSVATDGTQGNEASWAILAISADGRDVAFGSLASNLVADDTNEEVDVFVHDRGTGTTTRVSVATDGTQGNESSFGAAISADGQSVAFSSRASTLVAGDTNGAEDIFVHTVAAAPPTVAGVAPAQGSTAGGTPVTLTGTRFRAGASVAFGEAPATAVTVVNSITITAATPAHPEGAADVVVTNPDARIGRLVGGFTYVPPCTVVVDPAMHVVDDAGGTGTMNVTTDAGCSWTAVSQVTWVQVIGGTSGSGDGTIEYHVDANKTASSRDGTILIGGRTFTIRQAAEGCTYTLRPMSARMPGAGGNGGLAVRTTSTCPWEAESTVDWIRAISGATGAGNGTVGYTVAANTTNKVRRGALLVGGRWFAVAQAGSTCGFEIDPTQATADVNGGPGVVDVSAEADGCSWTATSPVRWARITNGATGTGAGQVGYTVAPQAGRASRTTRLTIARRAFAITQPGCTFTIDPTTGSFGAVGGTGDVTVTASGTACTWTAQTSATWIHITGGATGTGSGTVSYTVTPRAGATTRSANIVIAGKAFKVTQRP